MTGDQTTGAPPAAATGRAGRDLERSIARLLTGGTYLSIGLMAVGVILMLTSGVSPLATAPPFDPAQIPADIVALRPAGYLWLGLLVILATPLARVAAAGIGFAAAGERRMVTISMAILVVISIGVFLGVAVER